MTASRPRGDVAATLAERRPGQMVAVHARPGEQPLAYVLRALTANQALLLADMLRGECR